MAATAEGLISVPGSEPPDQATVRLERVQVAVADDPGVVCSGVGSQVVAVFEQVDALVRA
jgi:hypothetical protein